jgi:hypothetical protein
MTKQHNSEQTRHNFYAAQTFRELLTQDERHVTCSVRLSVPVLRSACM